MPYSRKQTRILQSNKSKIRNSMKAYVFLLPSLAGVMAFVLLPFLDVIRRSFYDAMGNQPKGFANYTLVLNNESFILALQNTVRFLVVCIPILMLFSFLLSLLIQGAGFHGNAFKTIFLVPLAIPIASVVLLWRLVFDQRGYVNQIIALFGQEAVDWMNGPSAFYVLVFSYLWKNAGYDMVLWLAGLNAIPTALYEAAKVDGATGLHCLIYITIPNLKNTVFIIAVLGFVNSFKVFREAYLVAGNYPNESIYMLQHLFNNWFVKLDIHKMSAAAVMMSGIISVMLIAFVLGSKEDV